MSGSGALYQAAIVLIPVLLFGGAIREAGEEQRHRRETKGRDDGGGKLLGIGLVGVLVAGVIAEGVAIKGAIEPASVHEFGQRYLTLVLTLGTAGLAIWAAAPLLERREGWVQMEAFRIIGLVFLVVGIGQLVIGNTLHQADTHARLSEASKREFESVRDLRRAEERSLMAKEHLISMASDSDHPRRSVAFVNQVAGRLDQARSTIQRGLTAPNAVEQLNDAFDVLNGISGHIEVTIHNRFPDLGIVERSQLLLAERRLISTMGLVMSSAANQVLALRERNEVCEAVGSSEPECS